MYAIEIHAAIIGFGFLLDLVLSHKQRAIYERFTRWRKWLGSLGLREVIHRAYQKVAQVGDSVFGPRIVSARSIILGGGLAAVIAIILEFWQIGTGTMSTTAIVVSYSIPSVWAFASASFGFVITRMLIRLLARKTTFGRTIGVVSAELLTIKCCVLLFMVGITIVCVAIVIFGAYRHAPPKDVAVILYGFVVILIGMGNLVILPAALATTVVHTGVALVFLILHAVAKLSLFLELLLQGIIRTKSIAFTTCAGVVAGIVAITNVSIPFLHPIQWLQNCWAWQEGIDGIVVQNTTSFLIRLWLSAI